MSKTHTNFEVTVAPQRARTGTIEKVIQAAFEEVTGRDVDVIVNQKNDRTLEVTVVTNNE